MANNNDNKNKNPKKNPKKNAMGMASILIWAFVIVIAINYFISSSSTSGQEEIKFSELIGYVKSDMVEEVKLESSKYTVTLTEEGQTTWLQEYYGEEYSEELEMPTLYAAPLTYTDFLLLLDEHGVSYYTPYTTTNYLTSFLVSYLLPMLVMVGLMILLFRVLMGGNMGCGLGIGNVG